MTRAFAALLRRDLRLARRHAGETVAAAAFFVIAATLFPLGAGPQPETLSRGAPAVLWTAALFAAMLTLDRLFAADREDGGLDRLLLAPAPLEALVLAKCLAHWLGACVPLIAVSPLAALALNLGVEGAAVAALSLLVGTPALTLVGAVGAALALGARRGGALVPLLVLPLNAPALVFGAAAVGRAAVGDSAAAPLMALGALSLAALALAPWAAAAALRLAAE